LAVPQLTRLARQHEAGRTEVDDVPVSQTTAETTRDARTIRQYSRVTPSDNLSIRVRPDGGDAIGRSARAKNYRFVKMKTETEATLRRERASMDRCIDRPRVNDGRAGGNTF